MSRCQHQVGIKPLLFISIRQRELVRVLALLVCLLIHNLLGLCTSYPADMPELKIPLEESLAGVIKGFSPIT